jgi:hypothetical protein
MRSGSFTHDRAAKRAIEPALRGGSSTLTLGQSNWRSTSSSNEIRSSFSARPTARTKRDHEVPVECRPTSSDRHDGGRLRVEVAQLLRDGLGDRPARAVLGVVCATPAEQRHDERGQNGCAEAREHSGTST